VAKKEKHIVIVFDVPDASSCRIDPDVLFDTQKDYRDERDVRNTLKRLGHRVSMLPVFDDIEGLLTALRALNPDVVFCMFESFRNDRDLAPHLVALLEMLNIPYTGANAMSLNICRDKALTKKILDFHGILVPKFVTIRKNSDHDLSSLPFPVIVKPLGLDASEGISQASLVHSQDAASKRIRWLQKRYECDVIVEEYIEGRELYVGVLGTQSPTALAPQELFFDALGKGQARIATHKAKWDESYRGRHGIDSGKPRSLSLQQKRRIQRCSEKSFRALNLNGYARIDFRMKSNGEIYVLEVNPNPAIKRADDFPACARGSGMSYSMLISKILDLAA
jgi:D-alanine-D-alanine ligase